jgi:uncharacterized protein with GYD domain
MKFNIDKKHNDAISDFREKQNKIAKKNNLKSNVGGDLTYCFTTSGIGEIIYVVHNATGAKLDLTDIESW